jgi:DAK2 domain fusion protein YloV
VVVKEKELDGQDLKRMLESAKLCLEQHIDEVNALNVFPVPDGDTGINMFLTMESAVEAVNKLGNASATAVADSAARGALFGARGNSGVILSQILRGIAKGIQERKSFSTMDFANALHIASEEAYKVVAEPVEGTILTAIREAAEAASRAAERGVSFAHTITSVVSRTKKTVEKTPEMLPLLKEAGVVDAGAKGLYYVFEGMKDSICRKQPVRQLAKKLPSKISSTKQKEKVYGFDVQFMIQGQNLPVEEIRNAVIAAGECPIAVGDENLLRVHVHTMTPDDILKYARTKGEVIDIVVEDMDLQVQGKAKKGGSKSALRKRHNERASK